MHKPPTKPEGTDWERVKREAAQDAPITHTAADGPCDPNDAAAELISAKWVMTMPRVSVNTQVGSGADGFGLGQKFGGPKTNQKIPTSASWIYQDSTCKTL